MGGISVEISIIFGESYPRLPPSIRPTNKLFHPNNDHQGFFRLDKLEKEKWRSSMDLLLILTSFRKQFSNPCIDMVFNNDAAKYFQTNKYLFKQMLLESLSQQPV